MNKPSGDEASNQVPGTGASAEAALVARFENLATSLYYCIFRFFKRVCRFHLIAGAAGEVAT